MKVAIVHDDFIQRGGAERLVLSLLEIWPQATLYTSYLSKEWELEFREKNIKYKTSFMQKFPAKKRLNKYYAGIFLYPLAFESFDLSGYDLVISSSARFAHCVITKPQTTHLSYINSPARMFWEALDYFDNYKFSKHNIVKRAYKCYLNLVCSYYRMWDFYASQRADYVIANSQTPKDRILKYHKRESIIIFPFVDSSQFVNYKKSKENFYLLISRLEPWKRVDIAVEAFIKSGKNLRIVGDGNDMPYLKKLSAGHKNIELLGMISEEQKLMLLCSCAALVVTQLEDFGIVPLEAMAAGKPVIAYGKGGVLETVIEGKTGKFYHAQTSEALLDALNNFDPNSYLMTDCVYQAKKFDKEIFKQRIKNYVDSVYLGGRS